MVKTSKKLDEILFKSLLFGTVLSAPIIFSDSQDYFNYLVPSLLFSYGIGKIVYKYSNNFGKKYNPSSRL